MLNLQYHELIGKIEEYDEKKYFTADDYTLDKVLYKIERIGIEKLDDTQILINAYDDLSDEIFSKNAVILMTRVDKGCHNFYSQLFLEEALYDEQTQRKVLLKDR